MYNMLKCAMEKINRLENKLKLRKSDHHSVEPFSAETQSAVLSDASNSLCTSAPSMDHGSCDNTPKQALEDSFSEKENEHSADLDSLPIPSRSCNLISPKEVLIKYEKLIVPSKLPTLSVKLAREAFIGQNIMDGSTVRGTRGQRALPTNELQNLKTFLRKMSCPRFFNTEVDFEECWKSCLIAIGQACKNSRLKKK